MDLRAHSTSLKYRDTDPKAEAFTHEEWLSGEDVEVKLLIMSFFSVEFLAAADNLFCVKYLYGMQTWLFYMSTHKQWVFLQGE